MLIEIEGWAVFKQEPAHSMLYYAHHYQCPGDWLSESDKEHIGYSWVTDDEDEYEGDPLGYKCWGCHVPVPEGIVACIRLVEEW